MAAYFFDASALVKRYIRESGSVWVRTITDPDAGNWIGVSRITGVEVVSAVVRRQRSGAIAASDTLRVLGSFRRAMAVEFKVNPVTPRLLESAMEIAEAHGLRGYDAVQLAAALRANAQRRARRTSALTLVSADTELNAAAVAEGLTVDDPNTHR